MEYDSFLPFPVSAVFLLVCMIFMVVRLLLREQRAQGKNFPPGPTGLPVVGYIPFLTRKPHEKLAKLGRKWGDVFSLRLGSRTVVVLNSGEAIRELYNNQEFCGRPDQKDFISVPTGSPLFSNGAVWLEHRKLALKVLKNLDVSMAAEEYIKEEIRHLLEVIEKQKGKPVDAYLHLMLCISNYISRLCFGKRYDFDDPERRVLDELHEEIVKELGVTSAQAFLPWLKHVTWLRRLLKLDRLLEFNENFEDFMRKEIVEHKSSLDESRPKDLLDFYFVELNKGTMSTLSEHLLPGMSVLLYSAGIESVRTTLSWSFLIIAAFPEIQQIVHGEIDEVVGQERSPSFADHKNMRYTQSFLMEVQRWVTVVPVNLRTALSDSKIKGYEIPKETLVIPNIWAVHHDPECWENPNEFVPDRFIATDGSGLVKNPNYLPFSLGKRNCIGEKLAVTEMFLYLTSVLQKFSVKLPDGHRPDFDGVLGVALHHKPQKLRFLPRLS